MKILSFHAADGVRLGVETEAGVVDVRAAATSVGLPAPATMQELIAGGTESVTQVQRVLATAQETVDRADVSYAPPVNEPNKIICVGANYRKHAEEAGLPLPNRPIYFSKYQNSLAGHQESVAVPSATEQVDYEVELVAVIGRRTRKVSVDEALSHVFGYATGNDLSARELQMRTTQWLYGKAIDGFAPLGPYVVTADEVPDPQALNLTCWVNGELRQNSNTKDMVFTVAEMISDLSQIMTLEPGDLLYTGTPEGVILGMQEKIWLKPGDEISCEVEGLGVLTNGLVGDKVLT